MDGKTKKQGPKGKFKRQRRSRYRKNRHRTREYVPYQSYMQACVPQTEPESHQSVGLPSSGDQAQISSNDTRMVITGDDYVQPPLTPMSFDTSVSFDVSSSTTVHSPHNLSENDLRHTLTSSLGKRSRDSRNALLEIHRESKRRKETEAATEEIAYFPSDIRMSGHIKSISREHGCGIIRPSKMKHSCPVQHKEVSFMLSHVQNICFSLEVGDTLSFFIGALNDGSPIPAAMDPEIIRFKTRSTTVIEKYLNRSLLRLQELDRHANGIELSFLDSEPLWESIGNNKCLSDDSIKTILRMVAHLKKIQTGQRKLKAMLQALMQTHFLSTKNGSFQKYVQRSIERNDPEEISLYEQFCLALMKHVPTAAPVVISVLSPGVKSGKYSVFMHGLLSNAASHLKGNVEHLKWNELPLVPKDNELLCDTDAHLRPLIRHGPYPSVEDYMDINFRLLRTDCFHNLKCGIRDFLAGRLDHRDMNMYHSVQATEIHFTQNGISLNLSATPFRPVSNLATSSNFMYGNLLCLSPSGSFTDCLWATVVSHQGDKRGDKKKNNTSFSVMVEFVSEYNDISDVGALQKLEGRKGSLLMAESPSYYRSYQPILEVLKNYEPKSLPFQNTLIGLETPGQPGYLFAAKEGKIKTQEEPIGLRERRKENKEIQNLVECIPSGLEHPLSSKTDISFVFNESSSIHPCCPDFEHLCLNTNSKQVENPRYCESLLSTTLGSLSERKTEMTQSEDEPLTKMKKEYSAENGRHISPSGFGNMSFLHPENNPSLRQSTESIKSNDAIKENKEESAEYIGERCHKCIEYEEGECETEDESVFRETKASERYFDISKSSNGLDPSQVDAFNLVLRSEIGIIQGPPGTGKTFLGFKIVQHLLDAQMLHNRPLLVLTYKNHALDEFINHVLPCYPDDVVRVGGRSADSTLRRCNLNWLKKITPRHPNLAKKYFELQKETDLRKNKLEEHAIEIQTARYFSPLDLVKVLNIKRLQQFLKGMIEQQRLFKMEYRDTELLYKSIKQKVMSGELQEEAAPKLTQLMKNVLESGVILWLPSPFEFDKFEKDNEVLLNRYGYGKSADLSDYTPPFDDTDRKREENERQSSSESESTSNLLLSLDYVNEKINTPKWPRLFINAPEIVEKWNVKGLLRIADIWKLECEERILFVQHILLEKYKQKMTDAGKLMEAYKDICKAHTELENQHKAAVLRSKKIICMTITGASLNRSLLTMVKPEVVIVEEAAEVLEPQLLALLGDWVRHMVLIGDQEQLRPNVESYFLRKKYHFDTSMMERLISNKLPFASLKLQNRMRPEFAELLLDIYPDLQSNHAITERNNAPPCVEKTMYFWAHTFPETKQRSFMNEEEAMRAVRLALFFIDQGYAPNQITILGAYRGQVGLMRKMMKELEVEYNYLFSATKALNSSDPEESDLEESDDIDNKERVTIQTIDNYQGDENDIVIVSLVRSDQHSKTVGFLKERNRRCVAQSRSKCGLYFIGNRDTLSLDDNWARLISNMDLRKCVGKRLILRCTIHAKLGELCVKEAADIQLDFCKEKCGSPMYCGQHSCQKPCRPRHSHSYCEVEVPYTFPDCNHKEKVKCYKRNSELRCEKRISFKFEICGHTRRCCCYQAKLGLSCLAPCNRNLSCGHPCDLKCGENCMDNSCKLCIQKAIALECQRQKAEEKARENARNSAKRELADLKKQPFQFKTFYNPLTPEGDSAAEYGGLVERLNCYINPTAMWFPSIVKIEKLTNIHLRLNWTHTKWKDMFDPTHDDLQFYEVTCSEAQSLAEKGFPNVKGRGNIRFKKTYSGDRVKGGKQVILLVSNVLIGKVKTVDPAMADKMDRKTLNQKGYDSLFVKTRDSGEQIIIYNPSQVLPKYIIHLEIKSTQVTTECGLTKRLLDMGEVHVCHRLESPRMLSGQGDEHLHYCIAESQFLRLKPAGRSVDFIDYHVNAKLMARFEAKHKVFQEKYGQRDESKYVHAFHGTTPENIENIVRENFSLERSGTSAGSRFGKGIYLSEFPRKSLGYGTRLLLCKVLLGKAYHCSGDIPNEGRKEGFDSHIVKPQTQVDDKDRNEEIVIFDPDQILPCYVIALK